MFWNELKAVLKRKTLLAGVIVALFIPTLYSAAFLWAFWDPYDHTENLKVAVVNEDQPVTFQGRELNFGKEIAAQLQDNHELGWQFVNKEEALAGLKDNTYSMMIEIPQDFSEKVSTVFTDDAEHPVIYHVPNQAKNYMISMIQTSMVQQLQSNISEAITENYMQLLVQTITDTEEGIVQMKGGMDELTDGLKTLQEPLAEVINPNKKENVQESLDGLISGANRMTGGMEEKVEATKGVLLEEENIKIAAQPLELKEEPYTEVPNYGNGFVPFTLSLGLFIGAMVMTIVFPATSPFTKPDGAFSWFSSKIFVVFTAAIIQALIAGSVLIYGLGIKVENIHLFFLFTVIVSLTFATTLHFLSAVLKDAGRVVMILMIILQLTGSGGTFPTEMVPSFLQNISIFMPMTYAIAGFRALVANDYYSLMWKQAGSLSVFFIIAVIGSLMYFYVAFYKGKRKSQVEAEHLARES